MGEGEWLPDSPVVLPSEALLYLQKEWRKVWLCRKNSRRKCDSVCKEASISYIHLWLSQLALWPHPSLSPHRAKSGRAGELQRCPLDPSKLLCERWFWGSQRCLEGSQESSCAWFWGSSSVDQWGRRLLPSPKSSPLSHSSPQWHTCIDRMLSLCIMGITKGIKGWPGLMNLPYTIHSSKQQSMMTKARGQ